MLDFGLHEGEDTEFYLACGADVVAFEANQELVDRNKVRFAQDIDSGHLQIVSGAIAAQGSSERQQTFYVDGNKSVWGTTSPDWANRNAGLGSTITQVTVPVVDLKSILADQAQILYAKIDIEGADRHVLDAFKAAGSSPEFISIESSKLDLEQVIKEIEALRDLGYERFAAVQQATIPGSTINAFRFDGTPLTYRFRKHASGPFGPYLKQGYKSATEVIDEYRSIFRAYARFGDQSRLMRYGPLRHATRALNFALTKTMKRPLCGWFDTHAAR